MFFVGFFLGFFLWFFFWGGIFGVFFRFFSQSVPLIWVEGEGDSSSDVTACAIMLGWNC